MALYEHIYLVRQDVTAQQVEALSEQYKGVIEANGGKITKTEYWGVKTLAFRIKKNRKAHFTLFNIDGPAKAITEMERLMAISEDVIRSLTVRVEALDDGPSAMLQKRERDDDRGDRGFGGGFGGGGGGFGGGGRSGGGGRPGGGSGRAPRPSNDGSLSDGESF
jgi:small subunit ribosomal protein S6